MFDGVDIGETGEVEIEYKPEGRGIDRHGTFPVAPNPMGWENLTLKPVKEENK